MTRYIAFLRAINVAGHAIVKMADLNRAFVSAGCKDVKTVIQSGNVLFGAGDGDTSVLFRKVQAKVSELIGTEATVLFRKVAELERILKSDPFDGLEPGPEVKLYVVFLAEKVPRKPALPLVAPKEALEAIKIKDREVFIVSRRKTSGMFGFPNNFIEKELGVPATSRNWTTIRKIVELSS